MKNYLKKFFLVYLFSIMAIYLFGFLLLSNFSSFPLGITSIVNMPGFLSLFNLLLLPFVIFHLAHRFKKYSILFILLSISISFVCELNGMYNFIPIGSSYSYSNLLGTKLLGLPLGVILGWLITIYCSFSITNLLFDKKTVYLAFFDALIATSLDLVIDPIMTSIGAWKWSTTNGYLGIPLSNYLLWFFIVLMTCSIFRLIISRKKMTENRCRTKLEKIWLISPAIIYVFTFIQLSMLAYILERFDVILIGLLSSQTIALIAIMRFYEKYWVK